jgi:recombination protein RecA
LAILPHNRIPSQEIRPQPAPWSLESAAGRLVEIVGGEDTAVLTLAAQFILDAQRAGEQTAWIVPPDASFFAPDLVESGIDLDALVVVRAGAGARGARTADKLLRSGAFGAVIVDIGSHARVPTPLLARLASLAQRHHAALAFLTQHTGGATPTAGASSLGSLISLRVRARRQRVAADRFRCWIEVIKDKRRGPTWRYEEVCRGAPGMR